MHTDKNSYLAGELMWFKLYDVDASFHRSIDISKVAYVELLDVNNKPALQAKIALKDGNGNGSLFIPVTINSGKYKLRAYTNWMKNFDVNFFPEKIITITNTQKTYEAESENKSTQYTAEFFPEGGNLVNNIESKVAFKVADQYGKGVGYNGAVIDEHNDTIIKFHPLKFGIGNFIFMPSADHTYKAVISSANGNTVIKELPAIYKEGYVIRVTDKSPDEIIVDIKCNLPNTTQVYLFIHARQSVQIAESLLLQNGSASFSVNKNKLGDGISHITLFNNSKQPVCERLYFKYPSKNLELNLNTDKKEYAARKKINIGITSLTGNKSVPANLSM
jgi:hypothetical protein